MDHICDFLLPSICSGYFFDHDIFQGLPKTSYFKLIDIWLVFTLLVLIIIFGMHTLIGALQDNTKVSVNTAWSDDATRSGWAVIVNKYGTIGIGLLILSFNAVFWSWVVVAYTADPADIQESETGN